MDFLTCHKRKQKETALGSVPQNMVWNTHLWQQKCNLVFILIWFGSFRDISWGCPSELFTHFQETATEKMKCVKSLHATETGSKVISWRTRVSANSFLVKQPVCPTTVTHGWKKWNWNCHLTREASKLKKDLYNGACRCREKESPISELNSFH